MVAPSIEKSDAPRPPPPAPDEAEFAIRWVTASSDPSVEVGGGPANAGAVAKVLELVIQKTKSYDVEYFRVDGEQPPSGLSAILRRRTQKGKAPELTLKFRGKAQPARWPCWLPDPDETKTELDVTFLGAKTREQTYSFSCTQKKAPEIPNDLQAKAFPCAATMTRAELSDGGRVETWQVGGVTLLEASRTGKNTEDAAQRFVEQVVEPLLQSGVKPVKRSKTSLVESCKLPLSR